MQGGLQTYICAPFFFIHSILCLEPAFKHVVLVGGFAASDWLFNKVQEKLLPYDMNITRPEYHVSVVASPEINLILTFESGIRPCLMAPCHSITTALYALESLSLPTELSRAFNSIPLIQLTNKDSTMHILILMGSGVSRIPSLSSFQRFVYFSLGCSLLNNAPMQNTQVSETKEFRCRGFLWNANP
jgi:hypothetical protein